MKRLALYAAAASLLSTLLLPAVADAESETFRSDLRVVTATLARTDDLAATRSENPALRVFAIEESGWLRGVDAAIAARALPSMARADASADALVTGRSVALGTAQSAAPVDLAAMVPAASIALAELAARRGSRFDALYKIMQAEILEQLAGIYGVYARTGEDPALRRIASQAQAETKRRIVAMSRL